MHYQLKVSSFNRDELIQEMNELIVFFEKNFDYKKIRSSKIQKWINHVSNPNIEEFDKIENFYQIMQYVRALRTFKCYSNKIKKDTITNMLAGGGSKNDRSNDYFFEIDMARRFILREDFEDISLNDNTDIIFKSFKSQSVFIVFVAGLPRKPKLPFADWYSTYARSFSKAACSFPTRKSCALLPIASAILQNGAIRFVWQSLPPHQSTPVPTKQMPYPCNHRQQGFFVSHQDYPAHVPMPPGSLFYP